MTEPPDSLNSNHERRISVALRHIDTLLGEMENALHIANSKVAFPQYTLDLTAEQSRAIEEHIARIRAQLVRTLDDLHLERPPADIPVSRALLSHLTFADIAAEELRPRYMRGYGEIPAGAQTELNTIATNLQQLVRQFHRYMTECLIAMERNKTAC